MSNRSRVHSVFVALTGIVLGSFAWWWSHPPKPVPAIEAHWAPLVRVSRTSVDSLGPAFERWILVDARGDSVSALWKRAPIGVKRPWTVVLLGGLRTGDRAATLIPDTVPAHVLALDWPWPTSRQPTALDFARHAKAIHRTVLRSPALLALGVEAAARCEEVNRDRIALLGASLGVPPALAAMRLTRTPSALVLLFGSADLESMLDRVLRRALGRSWGANVAIPPLASVCNRLIRPLEPALHTDAAARVPTLIVTGAEDELLPQSGVGALVEALPHADRLELSGPHIRSHQKQRIIEISDRVAGWLSSLRR